jgi:hypothetical protein
MSEHPIPATAQQHIQTMLMRHQQELQTAINLIAAGMGVGGDADVDLKNWVLRTHEPAPAARRNGWTDDGGTVEPLEHVPAGKGA